MTQRIIYESPDSLTAKRNWFGDRAVEMIFTISEMIAPYMRARYPSVRHTYQTLLVLQDNFDTATGKRYRADRRILSNLIPGCPVFYAVRMDHIGVPVDDSGFRNDASISERKMNLLHEIALVKGVYGEIRLCPVGKSPRDIYVQKVLARRTMTDEHIARIFGTASIEVMQKLNKIGLRIETETPRPAEYSPFIVRQFDKYMNVYFEGIALTNLIEDCPVIYPTYSKDFAANRSGGFKSVVLPDDLKNEIARLDLTGCSLCPSLPSDKSRIA